MPLDGGVSCSGGSGLCGWVSCTHWWPVCFHHFSPTRRGKELDFCTLTVQIIKETLQLPVTIFPDDKGVIHIA